jgi:hypothetical protein
MMPKNVKRFSDDIMLNLFDRGDERLISPRSSRPAQG